MKKIAIHSVPRSGSTWLGQIFNSSPGVKYAYQPLFSYAFKSCLNEDSSSEEIQDFFEKLKITKDSFVNQKEAIDKGLVPVFEKNINVEAVVYKEVRYHYVIENILRKDPEVKIIGLIRNPLAVVNSWLCAPKEFRADLGWQELEEWNLAPKKNALGKEEYNGFQKWKEVTVLFERLEKQFPKNFKIVLYDDLVSNLNNAIKDLFSFCELELSHQTKEFINNREVLNEKDSYSIFKNVQKDDKWRKKLNLEITENIISELNNTKFEKYLGNEI